MAWRRKFDWRLMRRRCGVVLALLSYFVASIGFPVPAGTPRTGEQPFPCQSLCCGCQTAKDCQSGCCCTKKPVKQPTSAPKSCCAHKEADAGATKARPTFRWIMGLKALECKGASMLWVTTGAVTAPPRLVNWEMLFVVVDRLSLPDLTASSRTLPPQLRPPR